jgi:predicted secreted protein
VLHRGDLLVVALRGDPGTGASWQARSFDPTILRSLPTRYVYDHPGMPGSPATSKLTFAALKPGKTELKLVYGQPWERTQVWGRFALHVAVK